MIDVPNLVAGFVLGIIGSIIAAVVHPPLIGYFIKLFSNKPEDLKFAYTDHAKNESIKFGDGETSFVVDWNPASHDTIHVYNQKPSTRIIGIISDVTEFYLIGELLKYIQAIDGHLNLSNGQFLILQNSFGRHAIMQMFNYSPSDVGGEGDMHIRYIIIASNSKLLSR